jgi:F-type H+-transporting ATPase subunit b
VRFFARGLVLGVALTTGIGAALAQPALTAEVPGGHPLDSGIDTGALDSGIDGGLDSQPSGAALHEPAPAVQQAHGAGVPAAHETAPGEHGQAEPSAGHGEHARFSPGTFALQLLNFGVLLFLLIYFGGKAMNKSLRARHEQLKTDLADAARLRDKAKQEFDAQEHRLADLEKELAALRASIRQDAEREQARMIEAAQERAKKIQEEMRFELDQQVKEAEMLLRAEVASASVKLAEELVRKAVDPLDQRRLAQEFVAGFDGKATPSGGES